MMEEIFGSDDDEPELPTPFRRLRRSEGPHNWPLSWPENQQQPQRDSQQIITNGISKNFNLIQLIIDAQREEERLTEIRRLRREEPLFVEDHDALYRISQYHALLGHIENHSLLSESKAFFLGPTNMSSLYLPIQDHLSQSSKQEEKKEAESTALANSLRDQYTCCICLDLMYDPASLPCGHSGCLSCLKQALKAPNEFGGFNRCCPLCKKKLPIDNPETQLEVSFILRNTLKVLFPEEYGKAKLKSLVLPIAIDVERVTSSICEASALKVTETGPVDNKSDLPLMSLSVAKLARVSSDMTYVNLDNENHYRRCSSCQKCMVWSNKEYETSPFHVCDLCARSGSGYRWFCADCQMDICQLCHPYAILSSVPPEEEELKHADERDGSSVEVLHQYAWTSQAFAYRLWREMHVLLADAEKGDRKRLLSKVRDSLINGNSQSIERYSKLPHVLFAEIKSPTQCVSVYEDLQRQRYERFITFLSNRSITSFNVMEPVEALDAALKRYLPDHQLLSLLCLNPDIAVKDISTMFDEIRSHCWYDCLMPLLDRLTMHAYDHHSERKQTVSDENDCVAWKMQKLITVDDVLNAALYTHLSHVSTSLRIYGFGYPGIPRAILVPSLMNIVSQMDCKLFNRRIDEVALSALQDALVFCSVELIRTAYRFAKVRKVGCWLPEKQSIPLKETDAMYCYERLEIEEISLSFDEDREEEQMSSKRSKTSAWTSELYHKVTMECSSSDRKIPDDSIGFSKSVQLITEEDINKAFLVVAKGDKDLFKAVPLRYVNAVEKFKENHRNLSDVGTRVSLNHEMGKVCGLHAFNPCLLLSVLQCLPEFHAIGSLSMTVHALLMLTLTIEQLAIQILQFAGRACREKVITGTDEITAQQIYLALAHFDEFSQWLKPAIVRQGGYIDLYSDPDSLEESIPPELNISAVERENGEKKWKSFWRRLYDRRYSVASQNDVVSESGSWNVVENSTKQSQRILIDPLSGKFMSTSTKGDCYDNLFTLLPVLDVLAANTLPISVTCSDQDEASEKELALDNIYARKIHALESMCDEDRLEFESFTKTRWFAWQVQQEMEKRLCHAAISNLLPVFDMEAFHSLCVYGLSKVINKGTEAETASFHLTLEACELISCMLEHYIVHKVKFV